MLFITTISGFLQQFEMNDVAILQEAGYEIHYASNFLNPVYEVDKEALKKKGIVLHHIDIAKSPVRFVRNIRALFKIRRIIRAEEIRVVHCHNPMGGVLGRLAAVKQKKSVFVLYTAHGLHFYKGAPIINWLLFFPVEAILARATNRLITINSEDYRRAVRFKLRAGGKVVRIPGVGVRTEAFAPKPGLRRKVREELGVPEDTFYLLAVGELNQNKNHQIVLQALAQIPDQNIRFAICGRGYMKDKLKRKAEELGIADRVKLLGFRNDIPRMLAAADAFIFPSRREGLGIAAIEALAAGIPLITSDCRGTREYMEHGVNGLVCRNGTAQEYAEAILQMKENPAMCAKMAAMCLKTAEKFDISQTDKIMRKLYGDEKM